MPARRRSCVVLTLALTCFCACSRGHQAVVSSGTSASATTDSTRAEEATTSGPKAASTTPSTAARGEEDALRRRDAPPEGVPQQLQFLAPVVAPCRDAGARPPSVEPTSGSFEIGESVLICLSGFDPASPISVQVMLPGGETRQPSVQGSKDTSLEFALGPTDPVGPYVISATQGTNKAVGGFTAVLPRRSLLVTLEPTSGPPGAVFHFALVTPSANQTVPIDLYRRDGSKFVYATTLGPVTSDSRARGSYDLPTTPQSPTGSYCAVARPFGGFRCAGFTVG